MGKRRLVVVDLDGTLIQGNSLRMFMRIGLMQNVKRCKLIRVLKMIWLMLLRSMKLITHTDFKYNVIELIEITEKTRQVFKAKAIAKFNPDIKDMICDFQVEGAAILLATAAPDIYVPWIWKGEFIASETKTRHELRGEEKLKGVKEYMRKNNMDLYAVITDHYDDLPLLRAGATHNILVNPSLKTIERTGLTPYSFENKRRQNI